MKKIISSILIFCVLFFSVESSALAENNIACSFRGIPFGTDPITFCDLFNSGTQAFKISADDFTEIKGLYSYTLSKRIPEDKKFQVAGYDVSRITIYCAFNEKR